MEKTDIIISQQLLQIKAIKLDPANPFKWTSGILSPIYCDNRKTLSYPEVRKKIKEAFINEVQQLYPSANTIAGVATGAIAHGALVADEMDKPFVYIRSSAKKHGMENLIEGELSEGARVVVIEDLVSTGGSSLKAVKALRDAGAEVLGMIAIFSYGFDIAKDHFKEMQCQLTTLTNYNTVVNQGIKSGYMDANQEKLLEEWRNDPENWGK